MSSSGIPDSVIAFWSDFLDFLDESSKSLVNEECLEATATRSLVPRLFNGYRGETLLYDVNQPEMNRTVEQEFLGYLIVMVGNASDGTRLGAMGHCDGEIDDKTNVKLVIAGKGFDAAEKGGDTQDVWQDQKVGLYALECLFPGGKDTMDQDTSVSLRSFVKDRSGMYTGSDIGKFGREPVSFVSELLYDVDKTKSITNDAAAAEPDLARSSCKRKNRIKAEVPAHEGTPTADLPQVPIGDPIVALGSKYSPSVLPDHDNNPLISHTAAVRVNQFNWRDINNDLIPPWEYKNALRPGTVVLLAVTPKLWTTKASEQKSMTFQLVIRKLKVMRISNAPAAIDPSRSEDELAMVAVVEDANDNFDSIVLGAVRASASPSRAPSLAHSDVGMTELPGPLGDEPDVDSTKKPKKNEKRKEATKGGKK